MTDRAYPVDRDLWTALVAHATVSYLLMAAPLVAVALVAPPSLPDGATLLALPYYLAVLGVVVAPSVQSIRDPPRASPRTPESALEDGTVGDLQRRYVEDDLTEAELEERLERELE